MKFTVSFVFFSQLYVVNEQEFGGRMVFVVRESGLAVNLTMIEQYNATKPQQFPVASYNHNIIPAVASAPPAVASNIYHTDINYTGNSASNHSMNSEDMAYAAILGQQKGGNDDYFLSTDSAAPGNGATNYNIKPPTPIYESPQQPQIMMATIPPNTPPGSMLSVVDPNGNTVMV